MKKIIILLSLFLGVSANAEKYVLSDLQLLKELGIPVLQSNVNIGVGVAKIDSKDEGRLSQANHQKGRCGGYEDVTAEIKNFAPNVSSVAKYQTLLTELEAKVKKGKAPFARAMALTADPKIQQAVGEVTQSEISNWVDYLVGFGGRFHASSNPNIHVVDLKGRLEEMAKKASFPVSVRQVTHTKTKQNSLVATIAGKTHPSEIIVLGGHLDSINHEFFGDKNNAPGADDNASGSASLLEAYRVILKGEQPERTIEFMWYAAEEVGLYGSAEIAADYKNQNKDVVAVFQLDMVLYPGSGELVINSINDFTSDWLRAHFKTLNELYIGSTIIESPCQYACSDHASWFRKGYSTLFPTESTLQKSNSKIHTPQDVVSSSSSFRHATQYAKAAVAFALSLGNSNLRAP